MGNIQRFRLIDGRSALHCLPYQSKQVQTVLFAEHAAKSCSLMLCERKASRRAACFRLAPSAVSKFVPLVSWLQRAQAVSLRPNAPPWMQVCIFTPVAASLCRQRAQVVDLAAFIGPRSWSCFGSPFVFVAQAMLVSFRRLAMCLWYYTAGMLSTCYGNLFNRARLSQLPGRDATILYRSRRTGIIRDPSASFLRRAFCSA